MKRLLIFTIPLLVLLAFILLVSLLPLLDRPSETDYRLARGRALLDAENYIGALQTLRDIPERQRTRVEAHSYLGAAYLRLHLYQAAIKEFEAAIRQRPRRADPWIGLASAYIKIGDTRKAVEEARRATETDSRSADAWLILGRAHWMLQDLAEAENAGLRARELDPDYPVVSELLLHIYFDRNQTDKFQAELNRIRRPSGPVQDLSIRFYVRQGQFAQAHDARNRFAQRNLDRSILEAELALKRDPARMDLYPQLIRNLVRAGRPAEAIDFGRAYRGSFPIDFELGKAHWMLGQTGPAIESFQRASAQLVHKLSAEVALAAMTGDVRHWKEAYNAERIEQDYFVLARLEDILPAAPPMIRGFIYRYAALYDNHFYNKAAEEALTVLNDDPDQLDALFTMGTAYHRLGRLDEAQRYIERARESYPDNAEVWARLANIAISKNEANRITALMERAVQLEPNNAGYLYNLGWIYDQMGAPDRARAFYLRAIGSSPLSFEAMNNLALIYSSAAQPELALPLLEQATRTDPEAEIVYFNIASYHMRQREWRKALQNIERVLDLNSASADAAVEKGRILLELGRTEEAVEALNFALEFDAGSLDAYLLLSSAYEKLGHIREAVAAAEEGRRIRPGEPQVRAVLERLTSQAGVRDAQE